MTREDFIKGISHPRKVELANMIFDGVSFEDMQNAGFGRINVLEMAREISRDVEGQEELSVEVPSEDDGEKKESASDATSDNANQESVSSTPKSDDGDPKASEDGKVDTLGGNPVGTTTDEEDAEKVAANVADEANADAEPYGKGGAHETETLGGNPQTSETGQEDAEKLSEDAK